MHQTCRYYRSMEMSKSFNQIKAYTSKRRLPLIPIRATDVSIICEPSSFYQLILESIKKAKKRIALSALYVGTDTKESAIIEAIGDNLQQNVSLDVNVVLDANRATRVDDKGRSSVTALENILTFETAKLNLVKTSEKNSIITNLIGRFQKWSEILSTYHTKMLIFDDDIVVTGANLSSIYFERRQDRYMIIKSSKLLSDYMFNLLERLNQKQNFLKEAIRDLNDSHIKKLENNSEEDCDSYIIPLIQFGPSGLTDTDDFLKFIDSILTKDARIHMSSGYFNPSSNISTLKISSVLAPSERANGFYRGKGLLNYVPRLYSSLHKQYMDSHRRCKLFLYDKPAWSFHAKGVWVEGMNDLYIHAIGSSNFNCRSSDRDFETQLVLVTRNKDLVERLKNERIALWKESTQVEAHNISGLNPVYNLLARILKTFL